MTREQTKTGNLVHVVGNNAYTGEFGLAISTSLVFLPNSKTQIKKHMVLLSSGKARFFWGKELSNVNDA